MPDGRTLIGASFRGVPFFVEGAERSGGRRAVVHKFPLRDEPYAEDLGRDDRSFRIDGYVLGDDYLAQKDALIEALEDKAGPGQLVHPYEGVRIVISPRFSYRTSKAEGGIATFSIEFIETPAQAPTPTEVVDGARQVASSADNALEAIDAELVEQYDVAGLPAFAIGSAEDALASAAEGLGDALGPVVTATQELAELTGNIELLVARASSLARTPADVVDAFVEVIGGLLQAVEAAPREVMDALIDAYGVDLGTAADPITSTRARELANQTALTGALRRVFAIEAARLAPLVPYASIEEATAARDQVAELLEEQAAGAGDTAYPALVDLRAQVLRAVPGNSTFARVVTVNRRVPVPSLVLAYQLYGSVERESDVIARNGIRHPGFVAGELKVLSDG